MLVSRQARGGNESDLEHVHEHPQIRPKNRLQIRRQGLEPEPVPAELLVTLNGAGNKTKKVELIVQIIPEREVFDLTLECVHHQVNLAEKHVAEAHRGHHSLEQCCRQNWLKESVLLKDNERGNQ